MTEQLPPDVIAQLAALDPEITPELAQASWALLTPFHEKAGYTAPKIDRDLAYGDDQRHRLDVHTAGDDDDRQAGLRVRARRRLRPRRQAHPGQPAVRPGRRLGGPARLGRRHDDLPARPGARLARRRAGRRRGGRLAPATTSPPTAATRTGSSSRATRRARCTSPPSSPARAAPTPTAVAARGAAVRHLRDTRAPSRASPSTSTTAPNPGAGGLVAARPARHDGPAAVQRRRARPGPLPAGSRRRGQRLARRHGTVPNLVWVRATTTCRTIGSLTVDEPALGTALARFVDRHTEHSRQGTAR